MSTRTPSLRSLRPTRKKATKKPRMSADIFQSGGSWTLHVWKDGELYGATAHHTRAMAVKQRQKDFAAIRAERRIKTKEEIAQDSARTIASIHRPTSFDKVQWDTYRNEIAYNILAAHIAILGHSAPKAATNMAGKGEAK